MAGRGVGWAGSCSRASGVRRAAGIPAGGLILGAQWKLGGCRDRLQARVSKGRGLRWSKKGGGRALLFCELFGWTPLWNMGTPESPGPKW